MASTRLISTAEGSHAGAFAGRDWGFLLFSGCTWGASFLLMAEGLEGFEPGVVTWLRVAFGFTTLGLLRASRVPVHRSDRPRLALLGLFWMAVPFTLFPLAQQRVDSSLTGMLNASMPIFTAVVSTALLGRLPGVLQRVGLTVGAIGVVLVGLPSFGDGSSSIVGIVLVLLAMASYGVAINLAVPLQQRYGALPVLWRTQLVALVLTTPYAAAGLDGSRWDGSALAACVVLGVFGTALAYVAASTLAGRVGGTRASTTTYIIPPVAILLGVVFRDESIAALAIVGTVVLLIGAWLVSRAE